MPTVRRRGSGSCSRRPTTRSTSSRATPTTSRSTATTRSFLASAVNMDRFIDSVVATADHVKAVRGSDKTINISFDEWNVWYHSRYAEVDRITDVDEWPVAPRLLEDVYSVVDAVVFGNLLISLHPARRPGDRGEPRPAGERDRADHDRAGRPGVAADHVLPVRADLAPRPRSDARAQARLPDLRHRAPRRRAGRRRRRDARRGDAGTPRSSWSTAASTRRSRSWSTPASSGDVASASAQSLHDDDMHAANTLHAPGAGRARPERDRAPRRRRRLRSRCRRSRGRARDRSSSAERARSTRASCGSTGTRIVGGDRPSCCCAASAWAAG